MITEKKKAYMKAYIKAYYQKPEVKAHKKAYYEAKIKHQQDHPEEYLNVLGSKVYTNGVTKEMEKILPHLIDSKVKEMLRCC